MDDAPATPDFSASTRRAKFESLAAWLDRSPLVRIVDSLSKLSLIVVMAFYFLEADDRAKDRHYKAWQIINASSGQPATGGRREALEDLLIDHVSLEYLQLPGAQLARLQAPAAVLSQANLSAAFLINANLRGAFLDYADLRNVFLGGADLSNAQLHHANLQTVSAAPCWANPNSMSLIGETAAKGDCQTDLRGAILNNANFNGANLRGVSAPRASFVRANLAGADLSDMNLASADFTDAILINATIPNGTLSGARLCRTTMPDRSVDSTGC